MITVQPYDTELEAVLADHLVEALLDAVSDDRTSPEES